LLLRTSARAVAPCARWRVGGSSNAMRVARNGNAQQQKGTPALNVRTARKM
jgi:hypothetical protein